MSIKHKVLSPEQAEELKAALFNAHKKPSDREREALARLANAASNKADKEVSS